MIKKAARIFSVLLSLTFSGCSLPQIPPEVQLAESQNQDLSRAGAETYAPGEYTSYKKALLTGQENLRAEKARFLLFRDYTKIGNDFRNILKQGEDVRKTIQEQKEMKASNVLIQFSSLESRIRTLKELTHKINEGRLARKDLIKAELTLAEAGILIEKNDHINAENKFSTADILIKSAEEKILPIFNRYTDRNHINKWQRWVEETIAESKNNSAPAIIINKSERSLTIYKNGIPFRTYAVGLGRNGSNDKLHAGDNATPEGKYKIIKKLPRSQYHKALLINYPNEEDKRQFIQNKKRGIVPGKTGIGGLIEIHGGGKDSMTQGCISMDNTMIDQVYSLVDTGTPVTIVGAVNPKNRLSTAIEGL